MNPAFPFEVLQYILNDKSRYVDPVEFRALQERVQALELKLKYSIIGLSVAFPAVVGVGVWVLDKLWSHVLPTP